MLLIEINFLMMKIFTAFLLLATFFNVVQAFEYNDGHLHYNKDVWERLSPKHAIRYLKENGVKRAVVSSTPTEGTEKLHAIAPEQIIPFVSLYRNYRDRYTFHSDPTILTYLQKKIDSGIYKGIGEFHLFFKHKDTEVVKGIMQLAADNDLAVSAHSDYKTILTLIDLQPDVRLIWAHCGMDHPVADIVDAMQKYPNLYCDLSFRYEMFDEDMQLTPAWKSLLENQSTRFVIGMDTYTARWWADMPESIALDREWLAQLSEQAQKNIARENIDNWFQPD